MVTVPLKRSSSPQWSILFKSDSGPSHEAVLFHSEPWQKKQTTYLKSDGQNFLTQNARNLDKMS
ncbi:hypothetical protein BDR03DRAFT_939678 [Suillus americanus]|nr:hypothetical protein BDR03DRAFT_939678 [Suillus americanus]